MKGIFKYVYTANAMGCLVDPNYGIKSLLKVKQNALWW